MNHQFKSFLKLDLWTYRRTEISRWCTFSFLLRNFFLCKPDANFTHARHLLFIQQWWRCNSRSACYAIAQWCKLGLLIPWKFIYRERNKFPGTHSRYDRVLIWQFWPRCDRQCNRTAAVAAEHGRDHWRGPPTCWVGWSTPVVAVCVGTWITCHFDACGCKMHGGLYCICSGGQGRSASCWCSSHYSE